VEFGDHAQPAVLKNRSRKLQLGVGTARVAATSSIDGGSGLGQGSVQVVGVVALLRLSTCVV
jgi:hypothetical protein